MKVPHVKMWRVWLRDHEAETDGRIVGSPDAANAARAHAAWLWRHRTWRVFPEVFRARVDHTSDGSPIDPKLYEVSVDVQTVPDFSADAARVVG